MTVGVDDDVIGGAALGGKGSFDIGVADVLVVAMSRLRVWGLAARTSDGSGASPFVDSDHFDSPAVDPPRLAVVAGELDAVAGFEFE